MRLAITILAACGIAAGQPSQAVNPTQKPIEKTGDTVPVFRVTVVARTTKAINYHHRGGATMIGLRGTQLMPASAGEARVESRQGVIKIDANMSKLDSPERFGPEYLTFVMWAVTPEGRATNLGEVLVNGGGKSKLATTSDLQSFGLIVTAEPYFAVTQPSDVVVMENFVRPDTTGTIEELDAKFELLPRGQYTLNATSQEPPPRDKKVPLELLEARNAVMIARWAGAATYAADTFRKAEIGLENAEGYLRGKGGSKPIGTVAREAVQMAEDARIITITKLREQALATERADAADRETRAREQAEQQARLRTQAENEQRIEMEKRARAEADRARAEAERANAEADRARAEAERTSARGEAEKAKAEAEAARAAARLEADRAATERARLEETREALKQQQAALADSNRLRMKAESEKEALRAQLLSQFSLILETRDSARGLIVNMSGVLFDTGKYTLRPGAREKLAKVSGIILSHPGLKVEVEGHTDSIGGDEYNQVLSERRSAAVRDYLTQQGMSQSVVTAKGFGKTRPVASNDTAAGRQQNRRVELVVSGEILGGGQLPSGSQ